MMNKHKWKLILSSVIILLPILVGLALWDRLPEMLPTHWRMDGQVDGWTSRAFGIFAIPLILLALQWLAMWWTAKDPGNRQQSRKVTEMVVWIIPAISLMSCGLTYAVAFGRELRFGFVPVLLGLMFVVLGNYMPKCTQNRTIGVKVKWTLENAENWNATHRFAGKVWFLGGLAMMACAFLPGMIFLFVTIPLVVLPVLYSWLYHQKQVKARTATVTSLPKTKATAAAMAIVAVVLVLCALLVFTGHITVQYGETALTIEASYWPDTTIAYDAIETIEYRESDTPGRRVNGLGGAKLLAGAFQNEEFGSYTRYSYISCDACVVLTSGGRTLVLNGPDAESTQAIFEQIQSHME